VKHGCRDLTPPEATIILAYQLHLLVYHYDLVLKYQSGEVPELGCWRPARNQDLGQAAGLRSAGRESWMGQAILPQISPAFLGLDRGRDNTAVPAQRSGRRRAALSNGNCAGRDRNEPPEVSERLRSMTVPPLGRTTSWPHRAG
jgi:hypothetical protein